MKITILCIMIISSIGQIVAHEGHNHDAPKTLQSLKGGIIKPFLIKGKNGEQSQKCFVEVVKSKSSFKIYFFDSLLKSTNAIDFKLVATALPYNRGTKEKNEATILPLEDKNKFYLTSFDKKNSHKFDLTLKFIGPDYCQTSEEVTFIID